MNQFKKIYHYYYNLTGWWKYDSRSNEDIEEAYGNKQNSIKLLLAGQNYDIDFIEMKQKRSDNPKVSRLIKRDVVTSVSKGVAGLSSYSQKRPSSSQGRGKGKKKRN